MAEINFSKFPIIVGQPPVSAIGVGPGFAKVTIEKDGQRCELVLSSAEANGMGCGLIVAAHAAQQLATQQQQQVAPVGIDLRNGRSS